MVEVHRWRRCLLDCSHSITAIHKTWGQFISSFQDNLNGNEDSYLWKNYRPILYCDQQVSLWMFFSLVLVSVPSSLVNLIKSSPHIIFNINSRLIFIFQSQYSIQLEGFTSEFLFSQQRCDTVVSNSPLSRSGCIRPLSLNIGCCRHRIGAQYRCYLGLEWISGTAAAVGGMKHPLYMKRTA